MSRILFCILIIYMAILQGLSGQNSLWKPLAGQSNKFVVSKRVVNKMRAQYNSRKTAMPSTLKINIPRPEGGFNEFYCQPTEVFSEPNTGKELSIQAFKGYCSNDPSQLIRLTLTPNGVWGIILGNEKSYAIKPDLKGSYELQPRKTVKLPCLSKAANKGPLRKHHYGRVGEEYVNYRLALSASGEYTRFWGGVSNTFSAMASTINALNAIFERDLGIHLVLITDSRFLIFQDPATDPFIFDGNQNAQNQRVLSETLNSRDYDMGHLLMATENGASFGLAVVGSVCDNFFKGSAFTVFSDPSDYNEWIDLLAHEIGHQLGANHSFSHCGGFEPGLLPFEPGSGSTIMAYGGLEVCGDDNFVANSSDYFHTANIEEIFQFTRLEQGRTCAFIEEKAIAFPEIDLSGLQKNIPAATPFELEANITTAHSLDLLSFCWEQMDGLRQLPLGETSSGSPLFRSFPPSLNSKRTFPDYNSLWSGANPPEEQLPAFSTELNFRLTLRSLEEDLNAINWQDVTLSVSGQAGPFTVYTADEPTVWEMGSTQVIEWEVAATNQPPVNAELVDIFLVTDSAGQETFLLAGRLPNTGIAEVEVPFMEEEIKGRLKIKGHDHLFFNISNAAVQISFSEPTQTREEQLSHSITVFPNPITEETLTILCDPQRIQLVEMRIWNTLGQLLWQEQNPTTQLAWPAQIDAGTYLLDILLEVEGELKRVKKVVIKN